MITFSCRVGTNNRSLHGVFLFVMAGCGSVPNRTAPWDFTFNKTATNRSVGLTRKNMYSAPRRLIYKSTKHEKASGRLNSCSLLGCRYGVVEVFTGFTEPHLTARFETAPHRSVGLCKDKKLTVVRCYTIKTFPYNTLRGTHTASRPVAGQTL